VQRRLVATLRRRVIRVVQCDLRVAAPLRVAAVEQIERSTLISEFDLAEGRVSCAARQHPRARGILRRGESPRAQDRYVSSALTELL
jgi:hypothetical protein